MIILSLNSHQTQTFWNTVYNEVDGDMILLDKHLYEKYTIVKRQWDYKKCLTLTIENAQYQTWILLNN